MQKQIKKKRASAPYAGWFYPTNDAEEIPPLWKQTLMVLLVLFPLAVLEAKYLSPLLSGLNPSLAAFIASAVIVALISFPVMPIAISLLSWWLFPEKKNRIQMNIAGTLMVFLVYAIEILLFKYLKLP